MSRAIDLLAFVEFDLFVAVMRRLDLKTV